MQLSSKEFLPAVYLPSGIGLTFLAYIQFPGTRLLLATTVTTSIGHSRELLNLAKININEVKYSGCNNSFTFKLATFHDICSRVNISPKPKMKVFSTMLKSLALNYYYSNITISDAINFDQVSNSIRNYFERVKYKQSISSK